MKPETILSKLKDSRATNEILQSMTPFNSSAWYRHKFIDDSLKVGIHYFENMAAPVINPITPLETLCVRLDAMDLEELKVEAYKWKVSITTHSTRKSIRTAICKAFGKQGL